jgi:hypothetical protein
MPLTVAGPTGSFSYSVAPKRFTEYRVVVWPTHDRGRTYSPVMLVKPRPSVSRPSAPSEVRAKRTFTICGYLKPKHKAGTRTVRLRCYSKNKDGSYAWRKTVMATNYLSKKRPDSTRYQRTTSLPSKGTWKIVAYVPGDSTHTEKSSTPLYVKVK